MINFFFKKKMALPTIYLKGSETDNIILISNTENFVNFNNNMKNKII